MLGSPSTFLPRTLFSEDEADSGAETDAQTEGGWDVASEALRKEQRPPRYPSGSFSSDDEDGPLHWSNFHSQIEALLRTVQKPQPRGEALNAVKAQVGQHSNDQEASSRNPDSFSESFKAANDGGYDDAASDSSADELLAYMTGSTADRAIAAADAAKRKAHSEVYGHPLPSWLYELATTADSGGASGSQEGTATDSTTQQAMAGQTAKGQEGNPGDLPLAPAAAQSRRLVPEWLTSPARPAQSQSRAVCGVRGDAGRLPEAVAHTPFKSLIEEIEANLAASFASHASTSFLYSDDGPGQPGNEDLQWFTNALAKAAAEAPEQPPRSPGANSGSSFEGLAGGDMGQVSVEDASCKTPSRRLWVFEEELAELDPLAETTHAATEVALESAPAHQAQLCETDIPASFGSPAGHCVDAELAGAHMSPTASRSQADEGSPVPPQQKCTSPVPAYCILRPSVSPPSAMQPLSAAGWAFLHGEPASQEKGGAEPSKASSSDEDEAATPAVYMHDGRRVLGELHSTSPLQRNPVLAGHAVKPSPEIQVFEDDGGHFKGAAVLTPEEDRLTAVYAQIDALSRDLRGTHDELEQLRTAEAQLKGIYEDLAQQRAGLPGVAQGSTGLKLTAEWAAHIRPQQVVVLEAAKRVLAQRLDALTAELADKDARLARITNQLHHAREQLAAKQREADVLLGETLGLQDVLTEAGAEAAETAAQLAALEAQLERSQARVEEVEVQLAEREAELAQCRGQLRRTEELLQKARQAAAKQAPADTAAHAQPKAASHVAKPAAQEEFSFAAGDAAGAGPSRLRPSSAEELSRAMVTPPVAERRAADREGSVGLTTPFTPSLDQTHRHATHDPSHLHPTSALQKSGRAFHNGKSPAWAAVTPVLRPGQPFAARRSANAAGGRSAWDVPSPSPMGASFASNAALASVLAAIRAREGQGDKEKNAPAEHLSLPDTPLASVLRRMNSNGSVMKSAAVI